jgi:hypothetical protein
MLPYIFIVIVIGCILAQPMALAAWERLHQRRRDRRESAQCLERWEAKGGPGRYRLPSFDGPA